ncbi:VOC family protein [Edaphobacillus lindanitolerans]|uniref:Glyoxalase/Bleomycin resistance protein/Dioxygenase superfamily protein n=1 Tax=Edaphobacillus lindanitolerans TaxID=550447 RepID=A0A1U7PKH7_9BACI|nr:VOC family protein [Edaphobacillus lindanitolerans]SIT85101.1 Glyoxalase/Bleomycin resistance protein/Dioxygenase superfamily protein [Edaphobacillus lindanitolerans]
MTHLISHVATLEIPVANLEESISFYTDILGAELHFQGEKNAMLTMHSKGVPTIFLVETEEIKGLSFKNTDTGIVHSVIDFYTPSLKELHEWLKGKQVEVGPLNLQGESGGFGFKDPSGNWLSACNILHPGQ